MISLRALRVCLNVSPQGARVPRYRLGWVLLDWKHGNQRENNSIKVNRRSPDAEIELIESKVQLILSIWEYFVLKHISLIALSSIFQGIDLKESRKTEQNLQLNRLQAVSVELLVRVIERVMTHLEDYPFETLSPGFQKNRGYNYPEYRYICTQRTYAAYFDKIL